MTEAEWLTSDDPYGMLDFLAGKLSERQLRLFACATVRRVWGLICAGFVPKEVELVERFVDGAASRAELRFAQNRLGPRGDHSLATLINGTLFSLLQQRPEEAIKAVDGANQVLYHYLVQQNHPFGHLVDRPIELTGAEIARQADLLRDVVGNPFRPCPEGAPWHTATATAIARAIHERQDFSRLPILADALEDAACDDGDLLNHCRQPGEHVRGCWVIDLLLDKE